MSGTSLLPTAEVSVALQSIPYHYEAPLAYLLERSLLGNEVNSIGYDDASQQVIYHHRIAPADRETFSILQDIEEIWILQRVGDPQ